MEQKKGLSFIEYYRIAVTAAYVVLGALMIFRVIYGGYNFIVAVLGVLFILFGLYRYKHIRRYFRKTGTGAVL